MRIEIETSWDNQVHVQWDEALDCREGEAYRALQATLESLKGVEHVRMNRYSARVIGASHVVPVEFLAEDVRLVLQARFYDATFDA